MTLKPALIAVLLIFSGPVCADSKLAVLGLSEEKSLESVAVQMAVDASNSGSANGGDRLRPWFVALTDNAAVNLELAEKIAADRDVLAVVLHGESAAQPAIIDVLRKAGLATVSASSWAQARQKEAFVTWLCPSSEALAESAALYARREARQSQVAVLDNGAPTAAAAAKAFANRFKSLGGKVVFEGEWQGTEWGLTRTTRSLKANWPQMLFFAGEGLESGRLVAAMKEEKELKATDLIGQPTVFESSFFNTARTKAVRTRGFFPCPDFVGSQPLVRLIGIAFPRTSPEYHAYVQVAYKKPGRWAAMLFDAAALAGRAIREAQDPGSTTAPKQVLSPSTQALSPVAASLDLSPTAVVEPEAPASSAGRMPGREAVRLALLRTEGYRGIRGIVRFSASREPTEAKAMVYYALTKVNKKEMQWREKNYGPPF
jgi:hypothetical protein